MRLPSGWALSVNCLTVRSTSSGMFMPVAMALRTAGSARCSFLKLKSKCSNDSPKLSSLVTSGRAFTWATRSSWGWGRSGRPRCSAGPPAGWSTRAGPGTPPSPGALAEVPGGADKGQALALFPGRDLEGAVDRDLLRVLVQAGVPAAGDLLHVVGRGEPVEQALPVGEGLGEHHRHGLALDRPVEVLPQVDEVVGAHLGAL